MTGAHVLQVTVEDIRKKNRTLYDCTSGPIWRRVVYEAVHDGDEFINLGGRRMLDRIAGRVGLAKGASVLEFGSGRGATCRYLAEAHDCAVTGIDMNPRQVEASRAVRPTKGSVRFIDADFLEWPPDGSYDAVLSLDTFMLLADPAGALATARRALRDGGSVCVSAIAAGPALDARLREWLWASDGMLTLLEPEVYGRLVAAAGFERVALDDLTGDATTASARMVSALDEIRDALAAGAFEEWRDAADIYLDAFRRGALRYVLVTGALPASDAGGEPSSTAGP
jgi:sarcosine/dimethylglycine N-methyltransferase